MTGLARGIAVSGIWIGVGISAFGAGDACVGVSVFALFATIVAVIGNN